MKIWNNFDLKQKTQTGFDSIENKNNYRRNKINWKR